MVAVLPLMIVIVVGSEQVSRAKSTYRFYSYNGQIGDRVDYRSVER